MRTFALLLYLFLLLVPVKAQPDYRNVYQILSSYSYDELLEKGDTFYYKNALDSALICYTMVYSKCATLMKDNNERRICIKAYIQAGTIHYQMYSYEQAQTLFFNALQLAKELKDELAIAQAYNNLGNVYAAFSDYSSARDYYLKAVREIKRPGYKKLKARILDNLMGVYVGISDWENLKKCLEEAELLRYENPQHILCQLFAKGQIYSANNELDKAKNIQREALTIADSLDLPPTFACTALINMAQIYGKSSKADSAIFFWDSVEKRATKYRLLDVLNIVYKYKSEHYSHDKRDIENYLHYANLYRQISDSINSSNGYSSIRNRELLFEMEQLNKVMSQMQIEQQLKEEHLHNQQRWSFLIGIALLVTIVLLLVVHRQKKQLQQSYWEIFKRNKELTEAENKFKQQYGEYLILLKQKNDELQELKQSNNQNLKEVSAEEAIEPEMIINSSEEIQEEDDEKKQPVKYQGSSLTKEQKDKLVQDIQDIMNHSLEFCQVDFTLERMAALINSRPKYISQVINEIYGKNFNRYVNEYRIHEAKSRLMDYEHYGHLTLKAIAQSVGFKSNSNFNILFKEITGITPSMYQEMAKKERS